MALIKPFVRDIERISIKNAIIDYSPVTKYTKLLLHMDGNDNGTIFTDESGKTVTPFNAVTKTDIRKFGSAAGYFVTANASRLTVPDSEDWNFGIGDFTIDFWVYILAASNYGLIGQGQDPGNRWQLILNSNRTLTMAIKAGGTWIGESRTSGTVPLNTWTHIAVVRHGTGAGSLKIYIGGIDYTTISTDLAGKTFPNCPGNLFIGQTGYTDGLYPLSGYLDEFRILKGIAQWKASFTPESLPYAS